jgi:hypothetical protein
MAKKTQAAAPRRMTDQEVMVLLVNPDSPLNRARKVLSGIIGAAEQRMEQNHTTSPIETRRLEFEGVEKILAAYNGAKK